MKTNELMIGDWVECYSKSQCQLIQTKTKEVLDGYIYDDKEDIYYFGNIKPIPLTEEIFERSGWLHNRKWNSENDGRTFAFNFSEWKVSYEDTNVRIIFWKNRSKYLRIVKPGADFIEIPVEFVHELQHALRLCSLSKLADNFKLE